MSDTASASFTAARLNGISPLPHLGVIRARGDDAARFLQGQLTQDVQHLPPGQARLAALCNPKGRMLASFWVLRRADDELLLLTSADTLAATLKRLSLFVLRARLKLSDATGELTLRGLIGDARVHQEAPHAIGDVAQAWSSRRIGQARAVGLGDLGRGRRRRGGRVLCAEQRGGECAGEGEGAQREPEEVASRGHAPAFVISTRSPVKSMVDRPFLVSRRSRC
ncbi:MAG: hypothetical protein J0L74_14220 [Burkholderiales bacterium]|nr:hypothetical protein [Burkholderiales bacterium]